MKHSSVYHQILDRYHNFRYRKVCIKHFKELLRLQHFPNKELEGEKEYVSYWKRLTTVVEPFSYRFFANYCGKTKYIVPENIGHSYIESKLNPQKYCVYYEDKGVFAKIFPRNWLPTHLIYRINGGTLLDADYHPINVISFFSSSQEICQYLRQHSSSVRFIIKPSVDSCSGRGVLLLDIRDGLLCITKTGKIVDGQFLYNYHNNFVLQEAIVQHPQLAYFCKSSVNTLRICTYRSVQDEEIVVTAAAIRIGHEGSVVDNLHAGGGFVGINVRTGQLFHQVLDQYGNRHSSLNGINFATNTFNIPYWEKIIDFAKDVSLCNPHCRIFALDITINKQGTPILIEWNLSGFSYWIPMMIGVTPFGDKTDEIVEYCSLSI